MTIQDNHGDQHEYNVLPCPLCGEEPEVVTIGNDACKSRGVRVTCKGCTLKLEQRTLKKGFEYAFLFTLTKWNRRAGI